MGIAAYTTIRLRMYKPQNMMMNGQKNMTLERNVLVSLTTKDRGKSLEVPSVL